MIRRDRRSGFSLIEALVALAIAALTLAAIFELQVQMVRGQQRAELALEQVALQENAIALTRDVNPMERPTGEIALEGGVTVRWQAEPLGEATINAGFPAGDGSYRLQRFRMTVEVARERGRPPASVTFERVGWRQNVMSFD